MLGRRLRWTSCGSISGCKGRQMRIISKDRRVQAHYEQCLAEGTSDTLAEMFALGQPPMSDTDREFMEGRCNGNQFVGQERVGDMYRKEAEAAGVDITGRYYMASLASYPGDPTAWVSDRADVRRVCEAKGMGCQGAVSVRVQEATSEPRDVPLAADIVEDKVAEILSTLPESDRHHVDTVDLSEQVREVMTPHWAK